MTVAIMCTMLNRSKGLIMRSVQLTKYIVLMYISSLYTIILA